MAYKTGISWTKSTFNGWIGCTKVGPGCDACYAEATDRVRKFGGGTHWGAGVPRYRTSFGNWQHPRRWNAEAEKTGEFWPVFCSSLADVFDNEVPDEWREDLFKLIDDTPHLTWQLVTKRVGLVTKMVPKDWLHYWPRNVWIIATMVNQEEFDRDWPKLKAIPAQTRGLSVEPQLGEIKFSTDVIGKLHWAIFGGESKQTTAPARECKYEWLETGVEQCRRYGISAYVKQMGHNVTLLDQPMQFTGKGADPEEWPPLVRYQEFPHGLQMGVVYA